VKFKLEAISESYDLGADPGRERLRRVAREVETYIRLTRQSIFDLRTRPSNQPPLAQELKRQCEGLIDGTGITCEFVCEGVARQSRPIIEAQLLRVGQEAVANAIRHGHPSKVRIVLAFADTAWRLSVSDNGRGFDPDSPVEQEQFGLLSMRERMELVGGRLAIRSGHDQGTAIEAVVPVS
jgi:signal transduction histidine kinase